MLERAYHNVKPIILKRICQEFNINPLHRPLAASVISRSLTTELCASSGLIKREKMGILIDRLAGAPELGELIQSHENLADRVSRLRIFDGKQEISDKDIGLHLWHVFEDMHPESPEDMYSDLFINSAVLSDGIKQIRGAKAPAGVIRIVNLYSQHLSRSPSEGELDHLKDLKEFAEERKKTLKREWLEPIIEELRAAKSEKDRMRVFLGIVTRETSINRACFFNEAAIPVMGIGSSTTNEHREKIGKLQSTAPAKSYNPEEDKQLNNRMKSLDLPIPRIVPDHPILYVQKEGKAYKVSVDGRKIEISRDAQNYEIHRLIERVRQAVPFDDSLMHDFAIIPVRNGKKLGFLYADMAYDKASIPLEDLADISSACGYEICEIQEMERYKNDETIGRSFRSWLRDYFQLVPGEKGNAEKMRGYLITYRDSILRKEKADYVRIVNVEQMINESFHRLLPLSGVKPSVNVDVSSEASRIIFQPYHFQGIIDGLIMNAIWSQEAAGNKNYNINIKVERKGSQLILTQRNGGRGVIASSMSDYENHDLGMAIIAFALDRKVCDPDCSNGSGRRTPQILEPTRDSGPGFKVTIDDVEFI